MTSNPLARRLSHFVDLHAADHAIIADWCWNTAEIAADRRYSRHGERTDRVGVLLSGWACRYKTLADGKRQIVGFLLPGDLCDTHAFVLKTSDHDVAMLTDGIIASIHPRELLQGTDASPRLARALWWSALVDTGIAREWLLNIGQRTSIMRVAHLFCELWWRADAVGLSSPGSFPMPITQMELGDALGLTPVHINRMMRDLRALGLVDSHRRIAAIPDIARLSKWCGFNPEYLQLERRPEEGVSSINERAIASNSRVTSKNGECLPAQRSGPVEPLLRRV